MLTCDMNLLSQWFWRLIPANPMLVRIIQGGSRRNRHLMVRMGYLGAMIFVVIFGLLSAGGLNQQVSLTDLAKAGTMIFSIIAHAQVVLICLLAPLFMAGAITAEQSGQTLNIMLTTPLSNLQIVLGSLLGRLFFVWALLLSGLPLFAILLIFGGVPIWAVFVAFAVAALAAFFTGSVAVTLAVTRLGGKKAVVIFVIAVAGYLVSAYAIDTLLLRAVDGNGLTTWLTPLHPLLVLEASFGGAGYRPPTFEEVSHLSAPLAFYLARPFATFTLLSLTIGSLLIGWSATQVRRLGDEGWLWLPGWVRRALRLSTANGGKTRPPREVWHNPVAWREANTRGNAAGSIITRSAFACIALLLAVVWLGMYHTGRLPQLMDGNVPVPEHVVFRYGLYTLILLEISVLTLVAIYMSAGSVSREREDRTLDLMLTTPITPKMYIWGKLRGLVSFLSLLLALPVATMLIVACYAQLGLWLDWPQATVQHLIPGGTISAPLLFVEAPLIMALLLVPFTAWCVALGMSWSVSSRGVLSSLVATVAVVVCVAVVLGLCGGWSVRTIPYLGVAINALSPATNMMMVINPLEHIEGFSESGSPYVQGRVTVAICAAIAAMTYGVVMYSILTGVVRSFDQTVRRISGQG